MTPEEELELLRMAEDIAKKGTFYPIARMGSPADDEIVADCQDHVLSVVNNKELCDAIKRSTGVDPRDVISAQEANDYEQSKNLRNFGHGRN